MKILICIVLVIVGFVALLLIAALFAPKDYAIQRDIIINKPKNLVFNYIKYLKNQDYYSKWVMTDPNLKKEFRGVDGTKGFVYAWKGNNKAGEGEQEIIHIEEGHKIDLKLTFIKPFDAIGYTYLTTEEQSEFQTKVTWLMEGKNAYPMNLMTMFLKGVLGKDLEISLSNLKAVLEKS